MSAADETPRRLRAVDEIERLGGLLSQALTRKSSDPTERVTIEAMSGWTKISVEAVTREGETLADAARRGNAVYTALTREHPPQEVETKAATKVVHVHPKKAAS